MDILARSKRAVLRTIDLYPTELFCGIKRGAIGIFKMLFIAFMNILFGTRFVATVLDHFLRNLGRYAKVNYRVGLGDAELVIFVIGIINYFK